MAVRTISTGYEPRPWQANIHKSMKRFSVLVVHRRGGKTVLAINSLVDAALRSKKKAPRFAYIAPYRTQAKQIAWGYLKEFTHMIPGVTYNESELRVDFKHNGARIQLYGADNPDSMRGLYLDGVVFDEYADMKASTWGEVIRPAIADRMGWALFIGTPKGMNQFKEIYDLAVRDDDWFAACYDVTDTNALDPAELDLARKMMTENQYRQEMLCDFSASAENVLIPIDAITDAAGKHIDAMDYHLSAKVMGVDVARFGDDRSVIFKRQGLQAHEPAVYDDIDNMDLANRVGHFINEWKPDAVFVDAGRGEGVIDRLRQLGHSVVEVNFGGKAANQRYLNKRTEMWCEMADWIKSGAAIPNHRDLKTDLSVPTYKFNEAGKLVLEPKEKIKERGMRSPDLADALALTFAAPVAPKVSALDRPAKGYGKASHDYDPF